MMMTMTIHNCLPGGGTKCMKQTSSSTSIIQATPQRQ